ncbi:MAG: DsbA family oxidoreductase [Pseudomonadales bacterium]|nr:DsbA family oxidoreductase [Pseudomonadales bacterium]
MTTSNEQPLSTPAVTIDIVSDVLCPWCVIGYKQLEKALAQISTEMTVSIHWQPFQLVPDLAPGGQNTAERIQQKYGMSAEQSTASRQRLMELGNSLGFDFNYTDGTRSYNTFNAHQLLHWAAGYGLQTELKMALFSACFTEHKAIDEIDVLVEIAECVGLDGENARDILDEQIYSEAVDAISMQWREAGISSVPGYIFNKKYLLSGAQEPAAFISCIEKVLADEAENSG